jgi:hypothetical protein
VRNIKTYQDLLAVGESDRARMEFVLEAIREHKASDDYATAVDADLYYRHRNPTIMRYQKFVHNQFGQKVPDTWSANNKIASNWYNKFTVQAVSYLLGNGVTFGKPETKDRLGDNFDKAIQDAATAAKNGAVSFVFWNYDHTEVFPFTEFVPLWDEEDAQLKAGIRFWQIDDDRPLRATLYELDGITEYIKRKSKDMEIYRPKYPYKLTRGTSEATGTEILAMENYAGFPIVPLWNVGKQSDLVGNRGTIDAYDLLTSGLVNNVSDGEFLYWILTNCDGMTDVEVVQFIEQLALTHVAKAGAGEEGAKVDAHKAEVPFEATAEALDRLVSQLYNDFMALRVEEISAKSVTNDQIQSAYEPLNQKTDLFEYQVTKCIKGILDIAGIDDEPTYTRSQMSNRKETADMLLASAEYLDDEYITAKLLTLFGDADKIEEVMQRKIADSANRFANNPVNTEGEE